MADGDIKDNNPVSFAVVVPKSATDQTVRDYLRLGDEDSTYEGKLENPSTTDTLATHAGALIYSTEQVSLVGPTITQTASIVSDWSSDKLSIVGNDGKFSSATWLAGSQTWPATTTFQRADDFNTMLGSTTNVITGNSITQYVGNTASAGLGSTMRSNNGHTQNIFSGQVVNITNKSIAVQGSGQISVVPDYKIVSSNSVTLAVSPAAGIAPWASLLGKIAVWGGAVSAACQGGLNLADSIVTEVVGAATKSDVEDVKDAMKASLAEVATITSGVLILQAMAAAAGIAAGITGRANAAAAPSRIEITQAGVFIRAGITQMAISSAAIETSTAITRLQTDIYSID